MHGKKNKWNGSEVWEMKRSILSNIRRQFHRFFKVILLVEICTLSFLALTI